jgi:hypothetical protein
MLFLSFSALCIAQTHEEPSETETRTSESRLTPDDALKQILPWKTKTSGDRSKSRYPYTLLITSRGDNPLGGPPNYKSAGVREIDLDGNTMWEAQSLSKCPQFALRLADGNILIGNVRYTTQSGMLAYQTVIIKPSGKVVWRYRSPFSQSDAVPLPDGSIVLSEPFDGRIRCIQRDGKELWSIHAPPTETANTYDGEAEPPYPYHPYGIEIIKKPGDKTSVLIADGFHCRIVELDLDTRQVIWHYGSARTAARHPEKRDVWFPHDMHRLENGDTIVADWGRGWLRAITPENQVRWELTGLSQPWQIAEVAVPNPLPSNWKKPKGDYVIFVADADDNRVVVVDGEGNEIGEYNGSFPTGVSVAPKDISKINYVVDLKEKK